MPVSIDVGLKGRALATTSHQARHTPTVTWGKTTWARAQRLAESTFATTSPRPEGVKSFAQKAVSQVSLVHGSGSSRSHHPHTQSARNTIDHPLPFKGVFGTRSPILILLHREGRVKRKISHFSSAKMHKNIF